MDANAMDANQIVRFQAVLRGPWVERFERRRRGYGLTLEKAVAELIERGAMELELLGKALPDEIEIEHAAGLNAR